jgi:hypothetical protein
MDLDIGSYRLILPEGATVADSSERPRPFRAVPLARFGPFELYAYLLDCGARQLTSLGVVYEGIF